MLLNGAQSQAEHQPCLQQRSATANGQGTGREQHWRQHSHWQSVEIKMIGGIGVSMLA